MHGEPRTEDHEVGLTAEEFVKRRTERAIDPVAAVGIRGAISKSTLGLVKMGPGPREAAHRHDVDAYGGTSAGCVR